MEILKYQNFKYPLIKIDDEGKFVEPCPFCNEHHKHTPMFGHRIAHCDKNKANGIVNYKGELLFQEYGYFITFK
jgi:hypothetical protein